MYHLYASDFPEQGRMCVAPENLLEWATTMFVGETNESLHCTLGCKFPWVILPLHQETTAPA
jgi:hypothetical protein